MVIKTAAARSGHGTPSDHEEIRRLFRELPAQHRVLVPEYQQLSMLRSVPAEHQDNQFENPENQQVDDLEQHPASQPAPRQACWPQRRSAFNRLSEPPWARARRMQGRWRRAARARMQADRMRPAGWPRVRGPRVRSWWRGGLACRRR